MGNNGNRVYCPLLDEEQLRADDGQWPPLSESGPGTCYLLVVAYSRLPLSPSYHHLLVVSPRSTLAMFASFHLLRFLLLCIPISTRELAMFWVISTFHRLPFQFLLVSQSIPAVVCVPGQCLQGYSNTTRSSSFPFFFRK